MASFGGGGAPVSTGMAAYTAPAPSTAQIVHAPQQAINDQAVSQEEALRTSDRGIWDDLVANGYTGDWTSSKNWGAYDTLGGTENAQALFQQSLDYGKSTGDWSQMQNFMTQADEGNRKYHRNGSFGLGIDLMPHSLGGAALTLGSTFAGLGGFGGAFGLPGSPPVSGGFTNASALGGSLPAQTFGSIGTVGGATTGAGTVGSLGTGIGSIGSLGGAVNNVLPLSGLSSANAGFAGGTHGNSVLTAKNAINAAKLGSQFLGGGGQTNTPTIGTQTSPNIPVFPNTTPNFNGQGLASQAINRHQPMQSKPFMSVREMYNMRNK